jgi:hypothetical protein
MSTCTYCGQKAGWFSSAHEACVRSAAEGANKVASLVIDTICKLTVPAEHPNEEGWSSTFAAQVWAAPKQQIDGLVSQHRIPPDVLRNTLMQGWSTGAQQLAEAELLSFDRFNVVGQIHKQMGFSDLDVSKTDGFIASCFSMMLWAVIVYGDPKPVASVPNHPFNLRPGETALTFFGSVVYSKETTSHSYRGGFTSVGFPIGHGMYYRLGGFTGQRVDASTLQEIDYGGLLLTTHNIYFGGDHTNFRIPYDHVVSFRPHADGIGLFRDSVSAKAEVFTVMEANPNGGNPINARPIFGWFIFNLVHFLAQPEARALYDKA